jgi:hypothetical protein
MNEIHLEIEKVTSVQFQGLLIDFFGIKRSPSPSVYVKFDVSYRRLDKGSVESTFRNFQIVKKFENYEEGSRPLATVVFQDYPEYVVIFIIELEDNSEDWENVKELVREIILKAEKLKFKFTLVLPQDIMPEDPLPAWERIPDHYADRMILELWISGLTNTEIAPKVTLSPRAVTNTISRLRHDYGKDIVPKAEERRKRLLKN